MALCTLEPAFAQPSTVQLTEHASFPPLTFGSTETLAVNLANTASNPATGAAASCTGSVSFHNASGALIGSATSFTLSSGQISAVTLPFSSAGSSGPHAGVQATITVTPATTSPRPPCNLVFSLEITDISSGATHAVVTSQAAGITLVGR